MQGNLFFKFGFRAAGGTYGVYKITDTAKKITFKLGSSYMKIKFVLINLFFQSYGPFLRDVIKHNLGP